MTEYRKTNGSGGVNFAPILAFFYIILICADIFLNVVGRAALSPASSFASAILLPSFIIMIFYGYLISLKENARKGALIVIIPTLFSVISGYLVGSFEASLYSLFDFIIPTLAGAVIYISAVRSGSRASACAGASFLITALSIVETAVWLYTYASIKSQSISTLLFDGISAFIDEVIVIYSEALTSAAALYQADTAFSLNTEYLENALIMSFAIAPAVICAAYFFIIYFLTRITDSAAKGLGLIDKPNFGKFEITSVTNVVFSISATIVMFSLLFEDSFSAFTCGVFSVLTVLLPNYLILGIRRIFGKLSRVMTGGVSALIIVLIFAVGMFISPYLLILITVFFGTAEYRASKAQK